MALRILALTLALGAQPTADDLERAGPPELLRALKAPDWRTRYKAAMRLGEIGPSFQEEVLPALEKAVRQDPESTVRAFAAWGLGRMGPAALPALTAALEDGSA